MKALDEFMQLAMAQADEAMEAGEVPIGCVFVEHSTGTLLGSGRNMTNETLNATRHAELVAIDKIYEEHESVDWSNVDLFVTVEPCIMCAAALRLLGLHRVFYGTFNERFGGCGSIIPAHTHFMPPDCKPLDVVMLEEWRRPCVMALRKFYMRQNERAPRPKNKKNRVLKEDIA